MDFRLLGCLHRLAMAIYKGGLGMGLNSSERSANSALQTGVNQVAIATPVASLVGWWISTQGLPPEVVVPVTALVMSIITIAGTVLRNVVREKGWTKYIG